MTTSQTSTGIVPSDFVKTTTDYEFKHFGYDAMRYIVQALNHEPVAIVAEHQTGFALVNVQLMSVQRRTGRDARVTIRYTYNDEYRDTNYRIDDIGAIIPLSGNSANAKWDALKLQHDEAMAAYTCRNSEHAHLGAHEPMAFCTPV